MGVGKTTLGKKLAKLLTIPFVDTDALLEETHYTTISAIIAENGEEWFRTQEHLLIQKLIADETPALISTGGGLPCFNKNMELMLKSGLVIYLEASVGFLVNRLATSKANRPLLKGRTEEELAEFIQNHVAQSNHLYRQAQIIHTAQKNTQHNIALMAPAITA